MFVLFGSILFYQKWDLEVVRTHCQHPLAVVKTRPVDMLRNSQHSAVPKNSIKHGWIACNAGGNKLQWCHLLADILMHIDAIVGIRIRQHNG